MTKPVEELTRAEAWGEWWELRETLKRHPANTCSPSLISEREDFAAQCRRLRLLIVRSGIEDGALQAGRPALHDYDEDRENIDRIAALRIAELRANGEMPG